MVFKNGVKNIQAAGYNGARTVANANLPQLVLRIYMVQNFPCRKKLLGLEVRVNKNQRYVWEHIFQNKNKKKKYVPN